MTREELWEKAKLLPATPGVYLMHGKTGKIIYVGKSLALKNRVSSYFAPSSHHRGKTARMVASVFDFEVYHTNSELEALLQENQFIKQYHPRYNIKLKDGGGYPYIKIGEGDYPAVTMVWRRTGTGKYFGPYSSAKVARGILESATAAFALPECGRQFPRDIGKGRPCLNFQIGRCMGVCRKGGVSPAEYAEAIAGISHFLRGDYAFLLKELSAKMAIASEHLNFELAAIYRDRAAAVKKLGDRQQIVANEDIDCDAIGLYSDDLGASIAVLFVRHGAIVDREHFFFGADEIVDEAGMTGFLQSFYSLRGFVPQRVCLGYPAPKEDVSLLSELLSEQAYAKVIVTVPSRGAYKSMTELACVNAKDLLLHERAVEEKRSGVLVSLAELLKLPALPDRIEAYDISNSGSEVASCGMAVLEKGRFAKRKYRSFTLDGEHRDDCSSLTEALTRRFSHSDDEEGWEYPDLILMDGGITQTRAAKAVLDAFGLSIPVFGMIKDEHHKTRTLTDGEGEIGIAKKQDIYIFLYKIQEEVHRFSLERMDARRRKTVKSSSLTSVKGVGEAKAEALLSHFGTLAELKAATIEQIAAVKGINPTIAADIYDFLHKNGQGDTK